jgi:hypothetical protein
MPRILFFNYYKNRNQVWYSSLTVLKCQQRIKFTSKRIKNLLYLRLSLALLYCMVHFALTCYYLSNTLEFQIESVDKQGKCILFCRLYPFSPQPQRQRLGPTCHLFNTKTNTLTHYRQSGLA